MAEIVQLQKNGVNQYPITTPDAVIDKNGKSLEDRFEEISQGSGSYDDTEIRDELSRLEKDKADKTELTELSLEVSGLSEEMANKQDVYVAEYGVTTREQIKAAWEANKHIVCVYGNKLFNLTNYGDVYDIYFACVYYSVELLMLSVAGNWSRKTLEFERQDYKVKTITSSSTDIQYPSAKAVYDALQNVGGGGTSSDKQGVVSQTLNYNTADNTYSVSNVVRGAIPSFFIDLVTEAGATFNAESGYFSLNGIDNIAYDEMRQIYDCRTGYGTNSLLAVYSQTYTARTNFAAFRGYGNSFSNHEPTTIYVKYLCGKNASITKFALCDEVVALCVKQGSGNNFESLGLGGAPKDRSRLEEIIGVLDITNLTGSNNFFYNGTYHAWLTTFKLKTLKVSIDLSGMPRLNEATILYMINNEKATSAIAITLHADAYERAMADAAIQEALTAHPNVSLAK